MGWIARLFRSSIAPDDGTEHIADITRRVEQGERQARALGRRVARLEALARAAEVALEVEGRRR